MRLPLFSSIIALAVILGVVPSKGDTRTDEMLTAGWKFIKDDVPPAAPTDAWENVTIPHTWNTKSADTAPHPAGDPHWKFGYYRGACWYERTLTIPAEWKGKRVFIRFEAASLVARTYINGQLLGEHRGGFTAFCYELTPYLKYGGANELRVQVDNSHQDDIPPLSGDFNVDGGIYRPVHLIATDDVCITPLNMASPGVYLTTKSLDDSSATVEIKTIVSNGAAIPATVDIKSEIYDATGKSVAALTAETAVESGTTRTQVSNITLGSPHKWNARKDPYLYKVKVSLLEGGKVVDSLEQPLGLRTVEITEDKGFLLNGKPYPIYGVDKHQDWGGQGWAETPANYNEDAKLILDLGVTAIRLAHYPQSDYWHDLCDRNGLLLWNEVSNVNYISDTPAFAANSEQQLRELILQRYNHPSAVIWGLFNELDNQKGPDPTPLISHLKSVVQELDSTRIIVGAADHYGKAYNQVPDHTAYNIYPGWYGPFGELPKSLDRASKDFGGKRVGISEYGAGSNPAQHAEGTLVQPKPKGPYHPEEWQTYVHETDWAAMKDNPALWGTFIWVMFDFQVAGRNEGSQPHLNDKGLVTQDRKTKKDIYYFYQANWSDKPMIRIASHGMTPRRLGTTEVQVFSNCDKVELFVNGKSLGAVKPDKVQVFRWENVALQSGSNQIKAVGTSSTGSVGDTCSWVLDPAAAPAAAGPDTAFPSPTPTPQS
jgi:beta-galactosidase